MPLTQRALQPAAESGLQLGCQAAVRGPGATGAGKPALRARLEVEGCGQERAAEGGSWPPGILPPSLSLEVGRIRPPSQRRPHADQRLLESKAPWTPASVSPEPRPAARGWMTSRRAALWGGRGAGDAIFGGGAVARGCGARVGVRMLRGGRGGAACC